jgi:oligoribonuclease (3'-5' exoribonuclease)
MRYVSIDIETTGLDPDVHQILELAMVIEDTEQYTRPIDRLPHAVIRIQHDPIIAHPVALKMNAGLIQHIHEHGGLYKSHVRVAVAGWLRKHNIGTDENPLVVAGKNVNGFDLRFIRRLPGPDWPIHHRVLDPAMYFIDWTVDDVPPDMTACMTRAGYTNYSPTHRALDDARDVIRLIRQGTKLYGNPLFA